MTKRVWVHLPEDSGLAALAKAGDPSCVLDPSNLDPAMVELAAFAMFGKESGSGRWSSIATDYREFYMMMARAALVAALSVEGDDG